MDVDKLYKKVKDKESFFNFMKALEKDFQDNKKEWENIRIDHYLESSTAWAEDSDFELKQNNWKQFADFLYSGKFYE